jgi:hypothetical protein
MKEETRLRKKAEADARLQEHIKRVVDAAPPLTPAQRDKLALLLRQPAEPHPLEGDLGEGGAIDEMLKGS